MGQDVFPVLASLGLKPVTGVLVDRVKHAVAALNTVEYETHDLTLPVGHVAVIVGHHIWLDRTAVATAEEIVTGLTLRDDETETLVANLLDRDSVAVLNRQEFVAATAASIDSFDNGFWRDLPHLVVVRDVRSFWEGPTVGASGTAALFWYMASAPAETIVQLAALFTQRR